MMMIIITIIITARNFCGLNNLQFFLLSRSRMVLRVFFQGREEMLCIRQ
jgi:hypothetical protein